MSAAGGNFFRRAVFACACLALLLAAVACDKPKPLPVSNSTLPSNVAKDFTFPQYDKENRLQSMVFGEQAKFLPDSTLVEVTTARVEMYDANGKTNMVVETPFCTVDRKAMKVNSSGRIFIRSPDGSMTTQGEGFNWEQATDEFNITNQVTSVIRGNMLSNSKP